MSVVVITGASAGIGRACVRRFADRGDDIGLIARDPGRLQAAAAEVRAVGGRAVVLPLDVADSDAVDAAADRVEAELGPIDIWVNNAMTSVFAPIENLTADEIRRVTDVTYHGVVHGTQSALRRMRPRDRGVIVQVGSALAYRSIPLQAAYCGAKAAARGFTDSLRSELIHDRSGVQVTMVHLPAVNTPQFAWVRSRLPRAAQPMAPIFQPEVAARAIVFAAEHPRRELIVGWSTHLALIGQRIAPGLMDQYLARAAWEGQQTDDPAGRGRPDNLDQTVAVDVGAHGTFDGRALDTSPLLWADLHRGTIAGVAGVGLLATGALLGLRSRRRSD